jgi:cytochrome c oxidase subunit 4
MANDAQHQGHAHHHSATMYFVTAGVLYCLTVLTFSLAHIHLGEWSFAIAMAIACTKGMFVILFFMHLWDQTGPSRLTMGIAVFFVLLLITLVVSDMSTRFPLALPPGSFRSLPPIHR